MPYQLDSLLNKCDSEDYRVLVDTLDSYLLVDSEKLRRGLQEVGRDPGGATRADLNRQIERELRYFGSADIAYFARWAFGGNDPPGVAIEEIIDDVSKRLKVKLRPLGTVESKLERLVKSVAEQTFFSLTPEQQRELFVKAGLTSEQQREVFDKLKANKALFLPMMLAVVGPKVLQEIVTGLIVAVLTKWLGKEAAKALLRQLSTKIPWWTEWLGPIVWALSLGWLALDLQQPAYRKTVPALLYLGIVSLRDGPEEGEHFWAHQG